MIKELQAFENGFIFWPTMFNSNVSFYIDIHMKANEAITAF